ncbi:MAG: ATP-binding protein [Bacteroidota bacterium]
MIYRARQIEPLLKKYLQTFSIVAITGPRQSGKSTLLRELYSSSYRYVTFDDYRLLEFFHEDPEAFIKQYDDKVIFDEAQKAPEIFDYLKIAVDNDRQRKGKYIITGSNQLNLNAKISESLAGRIGLLALMPFQYSEMPAILRDKSIYKGSYPEVVMMSYQNSDFWYSSYIETFVMKDVKSLVNIGDLHDFRQFIRLIAVQASQTINMSTISRILGISVSTVKRWISVLESSYIIFLLPSYHKNMGKRIVKTPKIYFYDTGLLCQLTGISNKEVYENGPMAGSVFENYLVAEIKKNQFHQGISTPLYYFRTSNEVEVDLVQEYPDNNVWVEIKKTSTFKTRMLKPIESVLTGADTGIMLYNGDDFPYKNNIRVLNYKNYLLQ